MLNFQYNQKKDRTKDELVHYYVGDRVMFTRNHYHVIDLDDEEVPVLNGFVGTVVDIDRKKSHEPSMKVDVDLLDGRRSIILVTQSGSWPKHLKDKNNLYGRDLAIEAQDVTLSYAATVHKTQGSTLKQVILYMPLELDLLSAKRELIYSAMTRAKERLYVWSEQPLDQEHLQYWVHGSQYQGSVSFLSRAPVD